MKTKQDIQEEIRKEEAKYDKMETHYMPETPEMKASIERQVELYKELANTK